MVMRTYIKLLFRSVKQTAARFTAVMSIVAVGVAFLTGLTSTTPDMFLTLDRYYKKHNIHDLNIKGTAGLTQEDLAALKSEDYILQVTGAYVTDAIMESGNTQYVTRIYGVPFEKYNTAEFINGFDLLSGRLPQNKNECIVAATSPYSGMPATGDSYIVSGDNKNYGNVGEQYNFDALKAVGTAVSPLYISIESEPSNIGKGEIELVMFVPYESYNSAVFTDAFITLKDAHGKNIFDIDYADAVKKSIDKAETLANERNTIRYESIINTLWQEYEQAKKETEESIVERKAALEAKRPFIDETAYITLLSEIDTYERTTSERFAITERQLEDALEQIEKAEAQLNDQKKQLKQEARNYEEAQKKAGAEMQKALSAIDSIRKPEWVFLSLKENVSYTSYKGNAEKIDALSKVFPVFFFFVASLVALTSITRLVDEQRAQTGTLKSLGYSNTGILLYYLFYSAMAGVTGSIIGVLAGSKTLPSVIINAYGMMYTMPDIVTGFWWDNALLISLTIMTCVTLSAFMACIGQLKEKPAALMTARSPKPGKRILLERITFIWRGMNFSRKVTARNIFRYKKRFCMTVIGITGCAALLLAGFGLKDSINDIVKKQFGDIYKFNLSISLKNEDAMYNDEYISSFLADTEYVHSYVLVHTETCTVSKGKNSEKATIYVPDSSENLSEQINFRNRLTGEKIAFHKDTVILTEKMCETLNIKTGDTVTITNSINEKNEFTVSGISENYLTSFVFISKDRYTASFSNTPQYKNALITLKDDGDETSGKIAGTILQSNNVNLLQFSKSIRESFANTVKSIDYIVSVIIGFAGALAVIVLYNLTNINICERIKELATLKVLGFYEKETAMYIYRETTILTFIGTLSGFIIGRYLHEFIVKTAEVDAVMFGRTIYLKSYFLAFAVTLLFTVIVDAIMLKRRKKIDMVESLKTAE